MCIYYAELQKFDDQIAIFQTESARTGKVFFHPFNPHLYACDNKNRVYVWDVRANTRINSFSNQNSHGSKITDMRFVNEELSSLLLCASGEEQKKNKNKEKERRRRKITKRQRDGSLGMQGENCPFCLYFFLIFNNKYINIKNIKDDGFVRFWGNSHINEKQKLVSAFVALPHMHIARNPGMLVEWQQSRGHLVKKKKSSDPASS